MFWHVADLPIGLEPKTLAVIAADRIDFCLEIVAHHHFHDPAPEDVRVVGSADDGNRVRREKGFQIRHYGVRTERRRKIEEIEPIIGAEPRQ